MHKTVARIEFKSASLEDGRKFLEFVNRAADRYSDISRDGYTWETAIADVLREHYGYTERLSKRVPSQAGP